MRYPSYYTVRHIIYYIILKISLVLGGYKETYYIGVPRGFTYSFNDGNYGNAHYTRRDNLYGNENRNIVTGDRVCVCIYYLNKTTVKY